MLIALSANANCIKIRTSDCLIKGSIVGDATDKNAPYQYFIKRNKKIIYIGTFQQLAKIPLTANKFSSYITGRGAGDGVRKEYLLNNTTMKIYRSVNFRMGVCTPDMCLIDVEEYFNDDNHMEISYFSKVPLSLIADCFKIGKICTLPEKYNNSEK